MIKAKNISFSYYENDFCIKNLSAEFNKGEICTVIGVNGSGKSTLLKLLSRQQLPVSGNLFIENKAFSEYTRKEFAKKVGILPQFRSIPLVSVYDFVSHGRFPHLGFSRKLTKKDKEIIENALEITHSCNLRNKDLKELSGGERQRVYISMLIAQDTDYILLDEPNTYLDISYRFEMAELILNLKKLNKGIISVSHDLSYALKISDNILLLDKGTVIQHAPPSQIVKSGNIEKIFNVNCAQVALEDSVEYIFYQKQGGRL